jgi:AcrR family transcriptional regulator
MTRRVRDAEASRRALLDAACALFEERGYDRATVREIGERAGVDPALIARYFGGKEGLYLAALADEDHAPRPTDPDLHVVAARALARWDERGQTPIGRALASPELGEKARAQVRAIMARRLLAPVAAELRARGCADAELRAELLIAVVLGVSVTRANGSLPALAEARREDLLLLLAPLIDALAAPPA